MKDGERIEYLWQACFRRRFMRGGPSTGMAISATDNGYVNYLRPDACHRGGITEMKKIAAMGETYYQSLILHNNAGPLGTAASLHAALAIPNVALLEAPWANRDGETDVAGEAPVWPYPEIVDGYPLPLEGPGLGIEADEASVDEELAASKPFVPSLQVPRLRGPAEWAGWVGAGFLHPYIVNECDSLTCSGRKSIILSLDI